MKMVKVKVGELKDKALDWAVAKCEGLNNLRKNPHKFDQSLIMTDRNGLPIRLSSLRFSTDRAQGGLVIEENDISVIRLEDESIPDAKGFWQGKYRPLWGAVINERHSLSETYGSQGDNYGLSYEVSENAIMGNTPLIAAMRCYVASKLGDEVEVPEELL